MQFLQCGFFVLDYLLIRAPSGTPFAFCLVGFPEETVMTPVFTRLTAAVFAAAVAVAPAVSAAETGGRTFSVKYHDLDLSTPDGRIKLQRRIERAVKTVCAPVDEKQLKLVLESRACREATLASTDTGLRQAIAFAERNRHVGG
jgi:UrcA family protein